MTKGGTRASNQTGGGNPSKQTPLLPSPNSTPRTPNRTTEGATSHLSETPPSNIGDSDEAARRALTALKEAEESIHQALMDVGQYVARLDAVEHLAAETKRQNEVLLEKQTELETENKLVKDELAQLRTEFEEYRTRPKEYDYERTIVVKGAALVQGEDDEMRRQMIATMFTNGLGIPEAEHPRVVATRRLPFDPARLSPLNPPGLKIELETADEQSRILRMGSKLKGGDFENLFMRTSQPPHDLKQSSNLYQILDALRTECGIDLGLYVQPGGRIQKSRFRGGGFSTGGYAANLRGGGYGHGVPPTAAASTSTTADTGLLPQSAQATQWPALGRGRPRRQPVNLLRQ